MLPLHTPVTEAIRLRYSCRAYTRTPLAPEEIALLKERMGAIHSGPLGTPLRFGLAAARPDDSGALRGLGTYGVIRNPAGFILGAAAAGEKNLEDFGFGMECIILYAASLGLGTCWLGGNFTRSSFSKRIGASAEEIVPAVASLGRAAQGVRQRDPLRKMVNSDSRLPWEKLFFQSAFGSPLAREDAGRYAALLDMVRLAPSAHNHQPWRVVCDGAHFHFYLQRTPGFGPGSLTFSLMRLADLQRVDLGIAMCHFDLAAREEGLAGRWEIHQPALETPGSGLEYGATWVQAGG